MSATPTLQTSPPASPAVFPAAFPVVSPLASPPDPSAISPAAAKVDKDALARGTKRSHNAFTKDTQINLAGEIGMLDHVKETYTVNRQDSEDHTKPDDSPSTTDLAKVVYFLKHQIDVVDMDALLADIPNKTYEAKEQRRIIKETAFRWQTAILTTYLLPKVEQIYASKLKEDPPVDMFDLEVTGRRDVWIGVWKKDCANITFRMWSPLASLIDFQVICNPPRNAPPEKKKLMKEWKHYLLNCFVRAADATFNFRIREKKKPETMFSVDLGTLKPNIATANVWKVMTTDRWEHLKVHNIPIIPGKGVGQEQKPPVKSGRTADRTAGSRVELDDEGLDAGLDDVE